MILPVLFLVPKRIKATLTSETRQIAVDLASDKEEANGILRDAGLPVPRQRKVYSARDAVRIADRAQELTRGLLGDAAEVRPAVAVRGLGAEVHVGHRDERAQR